MHDVLTDISKVDMHTRKHMPMSDARSDASRSRTSVLEILIMIIMALATAAIVAVLIGGNGLRITDRPDGKDAMITIDGQPSSEFDIDLGDPLPTMVDDDGNVTVAGQPIVEVGAPITVTASMLDPTPSQRVIWLIWTVSGPLLVMLIAWPVLQMARSARFGDPFTAANVRRLWWLAGLVSIGGTLVSMISGSAETIIMGRSAAADLFNIEFEISFLSIAAGLLISALASIWHVGVTMRDELDATI